MDCDEAAGQGCEMVPGADERVGPGVGSPRGASLLCLDTSGRPVPLVFSSDKVGESQRQSREAGNQHYGNDASLEAEQRDGGGDPDDGGGPFERP